MNPLNLKDFEKHIADSLIIDFRIPDIFEFGYIPHSINIGMNGNAEKWLNTLVSKDRKIVFIASPDKIAECNALLNACGFNNVMGYLEGGFESWVKAKKPVDMIISITPEELLMDLKFLKENEKVIDLRTAEEQKEGRLPVALDIELSLLTAEIPALNPHETYYLYCGGGYRSMIAASMLKAAGFTSLKNIYGGFTRIKAELSKIRKE